MDFSVLAREQCARDCRVADTINPNRVKTGKRQRSQQFATHGLMYGSSEERDFLAITADHAATERLRAAIELAQH